LIAIVEELITTIRHDSIVTFGEGKGGQRRTTYNWDSGIFVELFPGALTPVDWSLAHGPGLAPWLPRQDSAIILLKRLSIAMGALAHLQPTQGSADWVGGLCARRAMVGRRSGLTDDLLFGPRAHVYGPSLIAVCLMK
jgi:hypothetical protein